MQDLLNESEWTGFFLEDHRGKGWMNLHLQFEEGVVRGEGVDYVGTWHLQGVYSLDDLSCSWIKQYLGQHPVRYDGRITESGIIGYWDIHGMLSNRFHIWPVSLTHIQQEYLAAEQPAAPSLHPDTNH